jgi:hypothetical protein
MSKKRIVDKKTEKGEVLRRPRGEQARAPWEAILEERPKEPLPIFENRDDPIPREHRFDRANTAGNSEIVHLQEASLGKAKRRGWRVAGDGVLKKGQETP